LSDSLSFKTQSSLLLLDFWVILQVQKHRFETEFLTGSSSFRSQKYVVLPNFECICVTLQVSSQKHLYCSYQILSGSARLRTQVPSCCRILSDASSSKRFMYRLHCKCFYCLYSSFRAQSTVLLPNPERLSKPQNPIMQLLQNFWVILQVSKPIRAVLLPNFEGSQFFKTQ
jgi:hypothetical protein